MSQLIGTAWHEGSHAEALRHFGVGVTKIEVTTAATGETVPEPDSFSKLTSEEIALVALVGVYGESYATPTYSIGAAINLLLGATSDRKLIYTLDRFWWQQLGPIGQQAFHRRAEKFVQDHLSEIEKVANALLAKEGFPKVLAEVEFLATISKGSP